MRAVSEAAKTYDSGTAQVPLLTCQEGGDQVEEGLRSRGGAVPAEKTLAWFPDLIFSFMEEVGQCLQKKGKFH